MFKLNYIKGDCLSPAVINRKDKVIFIPHVCNDVGGWGSGFVLAINKVSMKPREEYRIFSRLDDFKLGQIQKVLINDNVFVVNMIAQRDCGGRLSHEGILLGIPNLRYDSLHECLLRLKIEIKLLKENVVVCSPKFGSGLAGGDWNKIEALILKVFSDMDLDWEVYEYE